MDKLCQSAVHYYPCLPGHEDEIYKGNNEQMSDNKSDQGNTDETWLRLFGKDYKWNCVEEKQVCNNKDASTFTKLNPEHTPEVKQPCFDYLLYLTLKMIVTEMKTNQ